CRHGPAVMVLLSCLLPWAGEAEGLPWGEAEGLSHRLIGMRLYDVIRNVSAGRKTDSLVAKLSAKEATVFALIGKGQTNRQIAEATGVQIKTVKFHVSRLLAKLGLRNRVEIALLAQQSGVGKTARG
ncbi:helix-turn-helix transcriptional regulator, partial [Rhizobium sp. BK060]|uniref:helix-turn-helix transcriptional regulator n=1 Tax=Rhizobium sp. BK060 TaxID=2587096 RepID=UPI001FEE0ACD